MRDVLSVAKLGITQEASRRARRDAPAVDDERIELRVAGAKADRRVGILLHAAVAGREAHRR